MRFQYECHDATGVVAQLRQRVWEFDEQGLMRRREASINDVRITGTERRIHGPRPASEHGVPFPLR